MSCIDEIRAAIDAGKLPKMNAKDLGELVTELDTVKALADERGQSFMRMAGEYIANQRYEKLSRVREQKETLLKLHAERQRIADPMYKGQEHHAFIDMLVGGGLSLAKKAGQGAAQVAEARHASRMNGLYMTLKESGLLSPAEDGILDRHAAQEMWAMDHGSEGITKNPVALKLAKALRAVEDQILEEKQASGSSVVGLKGRVAKTSHDDAKLRAAGKDAWINRVSQLIDREATFGAKSGEVVRNALGEMWTNIVTGELSPVVPDGGANLSKLQSHERSLIFKDGDSWWQYNREFGSKNLLETIQSESRQSAKQSALMERLGVNPEVGLSRLIQETEQSLKDTPDALKKFKGNTKEIKDAFARAYGYPDAPGASIGARISQGARVVKSIGSTGQAAVSAISDPVFAAAKIRSEFDGSNLFTELASQVGEFSKAIADKSHREQVAKATGIMLEDFGREIVERYGGDLQHAGMWSKAARAFQKINFMRFVDEAAAVAGASRYGSLLHGLSGSSFEALSQKTRAALERHGFDSTSWDLVRQAQESLPDGRNMLTVEALRNLPDESVLRVVGNDFGGPMARARAIQQAKNGAMSALLSAYGENAAIASSRGTQRINHELLGGSIDDGSWGTFQRLLMQFKAPMLSNLRAVGGAFMANADARPRTLTEALKGKGDFSVIPQIFILSGMLGYAKIAMKEAAAGRTPPAPDDPKVAMKAFLAGGMAGIYGDMLFSELQRSVGSSSLDMVAGPVMSSAGRLLDTARRAQNGSGSWKDVFNQAWDNVPGHNLFYTKAALDYYIADAIREHLSPGYRARQELRAAQTRALGGGSQQYFMFQPTR